MIANSYCEKTIRMYLSLSDRQYSPPDPPDASDAAGNLPAVLFLVDISIQT